MRPVAIVKREFSVDADGVFSHGRKRGATIVSLIFFRPTRQANRWCQCAYEICANGKVVRRRIVPGVDGVGALRFAMSYAVIDMDNGIIEHVAGRIPREYFDDMRARDEA